MELQDKEPRKKLVGCIEKQTKFRSSAQFMEIGVYGNFHFLWGELTNYSSFESFGFWTALLLIRTDLSKLDELRLS